MQFQRKFVGQVVWHSPQLQDCPEGHCADVVQEVLRTKRGCPERPGLVGEAASPSQGRVPHAAPAGGAAAAGRTERAVTNRRAARMRA